MTLTYIARADGATCRKRPRKVDLELTSLEAASWWTEDGYDTAEEDDPAEEEDPGALGEDGARRTGVCTNHRLLLLVERNNTNRVYTPCLRWRLVSRSEMSTPPSHCHALLCGRSPQGVSQPMGDPWMAHGWLICGAGQKLEHWPEISGARGSSDP